jgi:hypothetical protein
LIQDRPYRSAFSPETAVKMMIEEVEKYEPESFSGIPAGSAQESGWQHRYCLRYGRK